ncbi:MAG TPA: cytochrome b N-terminal domain-containing protein [Myxococcales bacterium]|nr:cytochrome b N-terminal domain-containing protein [Myxococcales bacterium]
MGRFGDWLDERTGHRGLVHGALHEPVRGGARWAYVFGSALVVLFALQALSGAGLALFYSPSATDAWASVHFIQHHVLLGWLTRGLHHYGASAMVVVALLHLLQTLWFGAYRAPRELNWLTGLALLLLVLTFALTGYLLPWDQKGYWATQVATSIIGLAPGVGDPLQRIAQGGASYGNLTLTRFYAAHVVLLPAVSAALIAAHLWLFRRHGVTTPPWMKEADGEARSEPFFPRQLALDAAFALLLVAVLVGLAVRSHGTTLEAPADPSSQYLARPEWYFLPLFQLLKYFHGPWELVGAGILPGLALAFVAALPFLHRWLSRREPRAARGLAVLVTAGLLAAASLGFSAASDDAGDGGVAKLRAQAEKEAELADRLAEAGVPVTGPLDLYRNDPVVWGERVYTHKCQTCHHPCSNNPYKGDPCLEGYASREWLARLLRQPGGKYFFGNSKIDEMDPYTGDDASLRALAEFLYAQGQRKDADAALAGRGEALFESEGCGACHTLDGKGSGDAPDLQGYASPTWLASFIRSPGGARFYGDRNKMETFDHRKLEDREVEAVVAFLRTQAAQPVGFK